MSAPWAGSAVVEPSMPSVVATAFFVAVFFVALFFAVVFVAVVFAVVFFAVVFFAAVFSGDFLALRLRVAFGAAGAVSPADVLDSGFAELSA